MKQLDPPRGWCAIRRACTAGQHGGREPESVAANEFVRWRDAVWSPPAPPPVSSAVLLGPLFRLVADLQGDETELRDCGPVAHAARIQTRNEDDGRDVIQEAYVRLQRNFEVQGDSRSVVLEGYQRFKLHMIGYVQRISLEQARKRRVDSDAMYLVGRESGAEGGDRDVQQDHRFLVAVHRAAARLEEHELRPWFLRYVQQWTFAEIAEALRDEVVSVENRCYRTMARMKTLCEQELSMEKRS